MFLYDKKRAAYSSSFAIYYWVTLNLAEIPEPSTVPTVYLEASAGVLSAFVIAKTGVAEITAVSVAVLSFKLNFVNCDATLGDKELKVVVFNAILLPDKTSFSESTVKFVEATVFNVDLTSTFAPDGITALVSVPAVNSRLSLSAVIVISLASTAIFKAAPVVIGVIPVVLYLPTPLTPTSKLLIELTLIGVAKLAFNAVGV